MSSRTNIYSVLCLLAAWCISNKVSVATVLNTRPCVFQLFVAWISIMPQLIPQWAIDNSIHGLCGICCDHDSNWTRDKCNLYITPFGHSSPAIYKWKLTSPFCSTQCKSVCYFLFVSLISHFWLNNVSSTLDFLHQIYASSNITTHGIYQRIDIYQITSLTIQLW